MVEEKTDQVKIQENEKSGPRKRLDMLLLIYIPQLIIIELICHYLGRYTPGVIKFFFSGFSAWANAPSYLWFGAFPPPLIYFVLFIWHTAFFLCYYWITEKITTPKQAALWLVPVSWLFGYLILLVAFGPAGMLQYATTWTIR